MTFVEGLLFVCMLTLFVSGVTLHLDYLKSASVKSVVTGCVLTLAGIVLTILQSDPRASMLGMLGILVSAIVIFIVYTRIMVDIVKDMKRG